MNIHKNARLTPHGRAEVVRQVLEVGRRAESDARRESHRASPPASTSRRRAVSAVGMLHSPRSARSVGEERSGIQGPHGASRKLRTIRRCLDVRAGEIDSSQRAFLRSP